MTALTIFLALWSAAFTLLAWICYGKLKKAKKKIYLSAKVINNGIGAQIWMLKNEDRLLLLISGLKRYLKQYGDKIKYQHSYLEAQSRYNSHLEGLLRAIDFSAERGLRDTSTTSYVQLRAIRSMILESGTYASPPVEKP
jgi:hypothetical protein